MKLGSLVVLSFVVCAVLPLSFYCSPYCDYDGETPLCVGIASTDCTGCDMGILVPPDSHPANYQCSFNTGYSLGATFSPGTTGGTHSTGFTPTWAQASGIDADTAYVYQVFGPFDADGQSYTYTFTNLDTNHYAVRLRIALYVTTNYDGAFTAAFLNTNLILNYGDTAGTAFTLDEAGAEYGYIKTSLETPHEYDLQNTNDELAVTFLNVGGASGNISVREVLVIIKPCDSGCKTCSLSA